MIEIALLYKRIVQKETDVDMAYGLCAKVKGENRIYELIIIDHSFNFFKRNII